MRKLLLIIPFVTLAACAGLPVQDQLRVIGEEMSVQYLKTYDNFKQLEQALPASEQSRLDRLREPLNEARQMLIAYNDFVLDDLYDEAESMQKQLSAAIVSLSQQITELLLEVYYESN